MTGFEPATPRPPGVCATGLRHIPNYDLRPVLFISGYSQSMARAKLVPTKGSANQNHSGSKIKKATVATRERRVNIQYLPNDFFSFATSLMIMIVL